MAAECELTVIPLPVSGTGDGTAESLAVLAEMDNPMGLVLASTATGACNVLPAVDDVGCAVAMALRVLLSNLFTAACGALCWVLISDDENVRMVVSWDELSTLRTDGWSDIPFAKDGCDETTERGLSEFV